MLDVQLILDVLQYFQRKRSRQQSLNRDCNFYISKSQEQWVNLHNVIHQQRQQTLRGQYKTMVSPLLLPSDPFNSLAPGKFEWNFRRVIFKQILVIDGWGISCEIALIWMSLDFTDDQSTLLQVMAWCRQATSHYLSQCWLSSLLPYGIARPQWINQHGLTEILHGGNE